MTSLPPKHLSPRKTPRQARSTATLEAIFEATIQVLLAGGLHRLTTTRVADRAGISVGTMYQYFPHKQALLYAVNEHFLNVTALAIERECSALHGASMGEMIRTIVPAYWRAKTERSDITRAIYIATVELDNEVLIQEFARRIETSTIAMFSSAPDVANDRVALVNATLLAVIFGTVRSVFERNLPLEEQTGICDELVSVCLAYADRVKLGEGRLKASAEPT
jgi:AcrR family transcriptional regulator